MGFGRRWPRPTKAQRISANNALFSFHAGAIDDPQKKALLHGLLQPVPPKRQLRRPVDGRPVGPSEHQEQTAVINWWRLAHKGYGLPEFALFAIPNGGARDPITGARLKAEGVRPGVFDLMLAAPKAKHAGLFIEMKVGANKPSPDQEAFHAHLVSAGYAASVHWNSGSAIDAIKAYLAS